MTPTSILVIGLAVASAFGIYDSGTSALPSRDPLAGQELKDINVWKITTQSRSSGISQTLRKYNRDPNSALSILVRRSDSARSAHDRQSSPSPPPRSPSRSASPPPGLRSIRTVRYESPSNRSPSISFSPHRSAFHRPSQTPDLRETFGSPIRSPRSPAFRSPDRTLSALLRSPEPLRDPWHNPWSPSRSQSPVVVDRGASPWSPSQAQSPFQILAAPNPVQTVSRQAELAHSARRPAEVGLALSGPVTSSITSDTAQLDFRPTPQDHTRHRVTGGVHSSFVEAHGSGDGFGAIAGRGRTVTGAIDTRRGGTAAMRITGPEGWQRHVFGPGETNVKIAQAGEGNQAKVQIAFAGKASVSAKSSND